VIGDAVSRFRAEVIEGQFPDAAHAFSLDQETERALLEE
jgi:ketopantoate hydroxymethyltransferase